MANRKLFVLNVEIKEKFSLILKKKIEEVNSVKDDKERRELFSRHPEYRLLTMYEDNLNLNDIKLHHNHFDNNLDTIFLTVNDTMVNYNQAFEKFLKWVQPNISHSVDGKILTGYIVDYDEITNTMIYLDNDKFVLE